MDSALQNADNTRSSSVSNRYSCEIPSKASNSNYNYNIAFLHVGKNRVDDVWYCHQPPIVAAFIELRRCLCVRVDASPFFAGLFGCAPFLLVMQLCAM